jgi:hypothetical protein
MTPYHWAFSVSFGVGIVMILGALWIKKKGIRLNWAQLLLCGILMIILSIISFVFVK